MKDIVTNRDVRGPLQLKSRLIHGSPTTGKSTFVDQANADGVRVLDTDELHRSLSPDTEWVKIHRAPKDGEPGRIAAFALNSVMGLCGHVAAEWINLGGIVLTNQWGPRFTDGLYGEAKQFVKHPSFQREPRATESLSRKRGGEILDVKLVTKWYDSWVKWAPTTFSRCLVLSEDEFLGNVITLPSNPAPLLGEGASQLLVGWVERMESMRAKYLAKKDSTDGTKRRVLLRVGKEELWVKVTLGDAGATGFEAYTSRPPKAYWTDNYHHGEPPIVDVTTPSSIALDAKYGKLKVLAVWPVLNKGEAAACEPLSTPSERSKDITADLVRVGLVV